MAEHTLRVAHLITSVALGGATENTITTCRLADRTRVEPLILYGTADSGDAELDSLALAHGIPMVKIAGLGRKIDPLADFLAYRSMVKWFRDNPIDVLHTHGSKAGILGRIAAAQTNVPVIVHTVHGWGHHEHMSAVSQRLYIVAERIAAKVTSGIITVSDSNLEKGLCDKIGKREQYTTIQSGIDLDLFRNPGDCREQLRVELGIPMNASVVGTVSRLAPQKAPFDFLKMTKQVAKDHGDVHFVFVGGGPMENEFLSALSDLNLGDRFHYLGYRNDVPQLYTVFDILVLSSLWEGLPRVFPQAMCAGLPIVATNVDGAPEVVEDGVTGYLTRPGDPEMLADRVSELLNDPERARTMGQAGLARVDPKFSDRYMVQRIESLYETLISKSRS